MCDTRHINDAVNNACTDIFCHLDADICTFSPEVQAKGMYNIRSMILRRIHSTGMGPAMAQPHHHQSSFDEDFVDYIPEELLEQRNNSFNRLSSFVAATAASMWFSAVLHMGGSAITSSSQPVPWSNSNSNSNEITNMIGVENTGLVDGSTIVEGAMSLGG